MSSGAAFLKRRLAAAVRCIFAFAIELSRDAASGPEVGSSKILGRPEGNDPSLLDPQSSVLNLYTSVAILSTSRFTYKDQGPHAFAWGPWWVLLGFYSGFFFIRI